MKLFISILSLLIFFWNINVQSPNNKNNGINQHTNAALENDWNNDFNGLWINEDNQTRSITKCKILYKNNRYVVQMWGPVTQMIAIGEKMFRMMWEKEQKSLNFFGIRNLLKAL